MSENRNLKITGEKNTKNILFASLNAFPILVFFSSTVTLLWIYFEENLKLFLKV